MPKQPNDEMVNRTKGTLRSGPDGHVARITLKGKDRESFTLSSCRTEAEAEERKNLLARLARDFRKAGVIDTPDARKLLNAAASCAAGLLPGFLQVAAELVGGQLEEADGPETTTFEKLAESWTSGELHRSFPDHVKSKDSDLDASRLKTLCAVDCGGILLGAVPLDRFTLDHAEKAMAGLPEEAKRPGTRRQYAQLLNRVLQLSVYPCRILKANPLPRGFLPKIGKPPAYPYLYPLEEAALSACADVPLARRVLFAFLAREGCRVSEAVGLKVSDVDLQRGDLALDENKTNDARDWKMDPAVTRALKAWVALREAEPDDWLFVDEHGRPFSDESVAPQLRDDLATAGVKRKALLEPGKNRRPIRVHDLRATFITLSLANGKSETWVADRTGHASSQMINRYRRKARGADELTLGELLPMDSAIPELRGPEVISTAATTPRPNPPLPGADFSAPIGPRFSGSTRNRTEDQRIKNPLL